MNNKPYWLDDFQAAKFPNTSVVCAGGGSKFISDLNAYGGSSQLISEAIYLNSIEYTDKFLGYKPNKYVSKETALDLAMAGYMKQVEILGTYDVQSIACTAKLYSDGQRVDRQNIACIALQTKNSTHYFEAEFFNSGREVQEEGLSIALGCFLSQRKGCTFNKEHKISGGGLEFGQSTNENTKFRRTVYPGSFNPMHHKHLELVSWAEKMYSRPVEFLLSMENYGKVWTNFISLDERIAGIDKATSSGELTNYTREIQIIPSAKYFYQKMANYFDSVFIVGSDNLAALSNHYYSELCEIMLKNNNRLLIFPRQGAIIPEEWKGHGRVDFVWYYIDDVISSTKLRKESGSAST
jgi:nicotinic acid mononucleotide adenylyltransferase